MRMLNIKLVSLNQLGNKRTLHVKAIWVTTDGFKVLTFNLFLLLLLQA